MIAPIHLHRLRLAALGIATLLAVVLAIRAMADSGDYAGVEWPSFGFAPAADAPAPDPLDLESFTSDRKRALSAEEAEAINLASPLVRNNPAAPIFNGSALLAPEDFAKSAECLTAAVYYEAASEPLVGQQAVAQVVLNRLRHPRYPKTVCGVVYQGSERSTGCQFTFTCDGALARQPNPAGWERARSVARAALSGLVSTIAGQATHYHTLAIVPVWAPSLQKVAIIGHHVFYRMQGEYGGFRPAEGPTPQIAPAALVPVLAVEALAPAAAEPAAPPQDAETAELQNTPSPMPAASSTHQETSASHYFGNPARRRSNLALPNS